MFSICRSYRVRLWQCPPFLFVLFGFLTVSAMVATYIIANEYLEEDKVVGLVTVLTVVLFVIGYAIVSGFERLAEASLLKSEFVSIVSHQLRTPLSSMRWLLEYMSTGKSQSLNNDQKEQVTMLSDITLRMLRLINLLLDVTQIEDHRLAFEKVAFDLVKITEITIKDFGTLAESRNVIVNFSPPASLFWAIGDPNHLRTVMQNLLDNAIQYSPGGGEVEISISRQRGHIRWEVRDTGVGIPEGEQKKIFEKFYRARNAARFQTRGSGLGLFMARAIIDAMGGKIGFRSKEQKGTTFWFELPAKI